MSTFFLSQFELLFEPITPKAPPPINPSPAVPDPVIVQAYFVLISNVGPAPLDLSLKFTSTLPLMGNTITIFDIDNQFPPNNNKAEPYPASNVVTLGTLAPTETGLFLLQPDIAELLKTLSPPGDITAADYAARGYAEVTAPVGRALITPQTRGTFLSQSSILPLALNVIAQEAYTLPIPQGAGVSGNLFDF